MRRAVKIPREVEEAFALRFRLLMSYHDLTLKDLADATGTAISTVGTWRNGRIPSSPEVIEQLAKIFGVQVEFLMEGKVRAGAGMGGGALNQANRILQDIDDLLRELGEGTMIREPQAPFDDEGVAREIGRMQGELNVGRQRVTRRKVESYLAAYLDEAEGHPDGLAHAYIQLQREFPLGIWCRIQE